MQPTIVEKGYFLQPDLVERVQTLRETFALLADDERMLRDILVDELLVRTPLSLLLGISPSDLESVFERLHLLLTNRRAEVAVDCWTLSDGEGALLASNCADVPFLLDTLLLALKRSGCVCRVVAHPILAARRDSHGRLLGLGKQAPGAPPESLILVWLEDLQIPEGRLVSSVAEALQQALDAARDNVAMRTLLGELANHPALKENADFLHWLLAKNFHLFGYRCRAAAGGDTAPPSAHTSLGIIAARKGKMKGEGERARQEAVWSKQVEQVAVESSRLLSPLHKDERLACVVVNEAVGRDPGRCHFFYGLFSTHGIDQPTDDVPALQQKLAATLERLQIAPDSYDGRTCIKLFNTFPKVELFLTTPGELERILLSFIALQRGEEVRVIPMRHLSRDRVSLLMILPSGYHTPEAEARLSLSLVRAFNLPAAPDIRVLHEYGGYLGLLARFQARRKRLVVDVPRLETTLSRVMRPWLLKFQDGLKQRCGARRGAQLARRFGEAFSADYQHAVHPRYAVRDILNLERLWTVEGALFDLWGPLPATGGRYLLQFYHREECYLNELMPLLENLGLQVVEEVDFSVRRGDEQAFIKSFVVLAHAGGQPLSGLRLRLLEMLDALWRGAVDNDTLNRLLILTGLGWREIDLFRAYRSYLFQLGTPFSKKRVALALVDHPDVALLLFRYFSGRFVPDVRYRDPLVREEEALSPLRLQLAEALAAVEDVGADRILRTFFNLIDSTVRTNYFLSADGADLFAFKISAIGIIDMPFPRPLYEIFVHGPGVEGIHLRGGKVARGGIRWSDRPDDFRTEILGLMKTQMTKNTVIVPVGAKGGFIVTTPYRDRDQGAALSRDAYRRFMAALLSLTDNRVGGEVVRPERLVAYDGDDPYLVVAADKGTAHLPDVANSVSLERSFWFGDAFASGGSYGYDHKKLGITARGAWEGVKRHFREAGKDIQTHPFTVVGIGDMAGDVFGNGMLLSRKIRLLGAFNHRHIFLDPDPDPESSWLERKRLFDLPRSSWDDYDRSRISAGGGVWLRESKEIPLSQPLRSWLGVRHTSIDGEGLIRLLLSAPVELLWNGGIGTYVKASTEKHDDVGDRANDTVRVDATQLRAAVVGEGGNLGLTQRARIEFALRGGAINTDAIDNSAGVDTSDHEVNLKLLMQQLLDSSEVADQAERDRLLRDVTEEVCGRVLHNNYSQTLALSLDHRRGLMDVEPFLAQITRLENAGLLDRAGEFLPTRRELLGRDPAALTRPELAVLLAYSKMALYPQLLESRLLDDELVSDLYFSYFPDPLRARFGDAIARHPLRREITATVLTNRVTDCAGACLVQRLAADAATNAIDVVRAYLLAERLLSADELRQALSALDNRLPTERQLELLLQLEETLAQMTRYLLLHPKGLSMSMSGTTALAEQLERFLADLPALLPGEVWNVIEEDERELVTYGTSEALAKPLACVRHLRDFLPLTVMAERCSTDLYSAASVLSEVRLSLGTAELERALERLPLQDGWDRRAALVTRERLAELCFALAEAALRDHAGNLEAYLASRRRRFKQFRAQLADLRGHASVNLHPLTVLLQSLERLLPADGETSRSDTP